jgi:hypothetical protein
MLRCTSSFVTATYKKVGLVPHAPEVQHGAEGEGSTVMISIVPCRYAPLGKYFARLASGAFDKVFK